MSTADIGEEPRRLSDFLRAHREEILDAWEASVRTMRAARSLPRSLLIDHMPEFLDDLASYIEDLRAGRETRPPKEDSRIHALERLAEGYDLADVVEEYAVLRHCIASLPVRTGAAAIRSAELPLLHRAIDHAISVSVARYSEAHERTLRALDRISSTAMGHHDVQSLLPAMLNAFLATTASVESVALSLREDGALVIRAAVGYPEPGPVGKAVPPDGFSAGVIRDGPLLLRGAELDAVAAQSPCYSPGTKAMYGAPLTVGDEPLGAVVMGSRTSSEFSQEDQLLFRTMVNRAAQLIAHARLQDEVARRAAELEAVIESIPEAVYVGDATGIKRANKAGLEMLGYTKAVDLDRPIEALAGEVQTRGLDGRPLAADEQVFVRALRGEHQVREVLVRHLGRNEDLVVRSSAAPVRIGSRIVGAVAVNTDITAHMRAEQALRTALEFRDRVLGVLSHDLRNPLGVIVASTYALQRIAGDEAQQRNLARIASSAMRIDRMIRDLLDYTRTRGNQALPIKRREVDLSSICRQAIDELQVLHPGRAIHLDAPQAMTGSFDPDRVAQVVTNLIENALRYADPQFPIRVSLREAADAILMEVHNRGPPIDASLLPRIFDAFQRGGNSDGRRGLGLGLYIVKHIVEAHGGSVDVRSTQSEGTTFSIRWPRH